MTPERKTFALLLLTATALLVAVVRDWKAVACFAAVGAAFWLGYRTVRAFKRASRAIANAPVPRSNVVPLTSRNGVRVVPRRDGRAS